MTKLKPIRFSRKEQEQIRKQILIFLEETVFEPIIAGLKQTNHILNNSKGAIISALKITKIEFAEGKFKGKFNARISLTFKKLGAVFNKRDSSFSFPEASEMPADIAVAIARQQSNSTLLNEAALNAIDSINIKQSLKGLEFAENFDDVIKNIDKQFEGSIKLANISFSDITETAKLAIAKEWSNNLKLFVRKFSDEQVIELRQLVQRNFTAGFRSQNLEQLLADKFNITKNKAKFLARQETSLVASNYAKQRYNNVGIKRYIWSTSQDERVRDGRDEEGRINPKVGNHAKLNGKEFSFDDPPITNEFTGKTANPGEDFGCRCVAIPVV